MKENFAVFLPVHALWPRAHPRLRDNSGFARIKSCKRLGNKIPASGMFPIVFKSSSSDFSKVWRS